MAVPAWHQINLPLLRSIEDGAVYTLKELEPKVALLMELSEEDKNVKIPSGQRRFYNRMCWSRVYLGRAGLLESPRRGEVMLSDSGRQLLANPPAKLDLRYLRDNYAGIREFIAKSKSRDNMADDESGSDEQTPEEAIDTAYETLREQLIEEILDQIKQMSPAFFEGLVVELLVRMGYGGTLRDAGQAVGQSGDGGIDGIIKEDRLGLDKIYIQAKRYADQSIGRPAIQAFVGALQGVQANKGIFMTTTGFANTAVEYAKTVNTNVVLVDGRQIAEYMIDSGLGVTVSNTYAIKRIDSEYFAE